MGEKLRRHSRLTDDLPADVREQVDRLLIEGGSTYEEIRDFLAAQGYDISRSAIGRYGKDFLAAYRRLRIVEDKSRALVSEVGDGLVLEEAASKIFVQMVLEAQLDGNLDLKKLPRILSDFAKLQASSVAREKFKREIQEKVRGVAEDVAETAKKSGLTAAAADEIRRKILGIV